YRNPWGVAVPLLACGVLACAGLARSQEAQSQDQNAPSVADAARRSRQEKAAVAKSAKKVITDDDLPTKNFVPGAEGVNVGSPPKSDSQPPNAAAVAADEAKDQAAGSAE